MAIQLNERDQQIFKLIEEHHVLLEKHISWFISKDNKPVLIRDRLRKLFYLDYLLCGRHCEILPWWTTPTKPLVYMLSSLARQTISSADATYDLNESKVQRHFLELANLRMLLLMAQKDGLISSVEWTTLVDGKSAMEHVQEQVELKADAINANGDVNKLTDKPTIEAKVSFTAGGEQKLIGIINSPFADAQSLIAQLKDALAKSDINQIWIICQDGIHQALLQEMLAGNSFADKVLFATHGDLYSLGIIKCKWQNADRQTVAVVDQSVIDVAAAANATSANADSSNTNNIWPLPVNSFPHAATA